MSLQTQTASSLPASRFTIRTRWRSASALNSFSSSTAWGSVNVGRTSGLQQSITDLRAIHQE